MIKLLRKTVSDKIAAGEVVERPLSVVKELMENSIDAGATKIIVDISKGGSEYIRVTDDGSGIPADEAEMAFLRHATSKIENAEDLDALDTLGFRGEALASIAAVSRTELITKTRDSKVGRKLVIEGGMISDNSPQGTPDGTTIVVRDLFYNTPARRKFMRSKASETAAITDLVTNIALAYPSIKIRMISNGNILFSTRGTGDRLDVIITVSGRQSSSRLLAVNAENEEFHLEGYVSGPAESRATRKNQVFFVNGRSVRSKVIEKGLDAAYKERLFEGRHPVAYLFLQVKPDTLDVNIHPTKQEIRFDNDEAVSDFIKDAVKQALMSRDAIPDIDNVRLSDSLFADNISEINYADKKTETHHDDREYKQKIKDILFSNYAGKDDRGEFKKEPATAKQVDVKKLLSDIRAESDHLREQQSEYKAQVEVSKEHRKLDFSAFDIKGVIFGTYILIESVQDEEFYMIDQHAAHERIFFEQLTSRLNNETKISQQIMIPLTFDCKRDNDEWIRPLESFGFEIEEFGQTTFIARAIPEFFDLTQAETFLTDYIDMLDDIRDFESAELKDRLAMRACKSAVKAHDMLKDEEISRLLDDLSKCENPFSCPHGRPTFIKMSRYDIEKLFKRV